MRHFGKDIARVLIRPVETKIFRDFLDDPPILARVAGQGQGMAAHLDLPVGVGDGAVLFRPGRRGQHHIGMERGFGQEYILHHEVL